MNLFVDIEQFFYFRKMVEFIRLAKSLQEISSRSSKEDNSQHDFPFALAIFLSLSSPDEISAEISESTVNSDVAQFISDLLRLRTNNNDARVQAVFQAIREHIRQTKCLAIN